MEVTRRTALKTLAAAAIGAGTGAIAHGYWYERHALQIVQAPLPVTGLAPEHEGLRIGFLTDLHHSAFVSQDDIARAVAFLLAAAPDLIVLGGDYVSNFDRRYMQPCAEALAPLTAPHGVFAILGNHDDEREMPNALARQAFAVLKDARTTLRIRNEPLDLAGIRFWTKQPEAIARVLRGATGSTLLLAHDPRRVTEAAALAIPAVLSGHTHGGQVVLPGVGAIAAKRFPHLAGFASVNGTSLFISRGIGTVFLPIRLNCPPDVAVLTLTRGAGDRMS
jgi:predicted MPP superfamily phosphohydrolase